ncbi:adenosylcobinamide amidohydrolase [Desulfococcus sp.]|uniref:adenosylcobinamide amidohydrolase n=1 Tax=Desulfococcus sp. TaxID=2025834 RepID=UPI003D0FAF97
MRRTPFIFTSTLLLLSFLFPGKPSSTFAYPVQFEDADHRVVTITASPRRVVSLVPSVTEIILSVGGGDVVRGVTYHDTYPPEAARIPNVGGFFAPCVDRIQEIAPDVIFVSDLHREVIETFEGGPVAVIRLRLDTFPDLFRTIRLIGEIFHEEERAAVLSADITRELDHTARKTARIPSPEKQRVIRFMGRESVMTPGDDSFQNGMIRSAGGIPPSLGKNGKAVPVTLAEWTAFNPQTIYGCGGDRDAAERLLNRPGWKDVDAVKNGRIFYFPCDLTCRLSSRTGDFVSCLSSRIYDEQYDGAPPVAPDVTLGSRPVDIPLSWVANAEIRDTRIHDFVHKTLLVHFTRPMAVTSTLEGFREKIRAVGNSYSPPQCWGRYHRMGLAGSREGLLAAIARSGKDTSLLFTGADMDNLSVQAKTCKGMTVVALVTAGVESNAVRMSRDTGAYYEPGTINMILMSNMRLSPRAMNRAVISATEAKTAALWDMDIRSSQTGRVHPATGTGTDNIIVVEGHGTPIDNAGGHSKMGELIADAVYAGVREAVFKQNGIPPKRTVFQRLSDRRISLFGLVGNCDCGTRKTELGKALEQLLLEDPYAGFLEMAFAVSDQYESGLISDLSAFQALCDRMSEKIAGMPVSKIPKVNLGEPLPRVLETALKAMLKGLAAKTGPARP